MKEKISVPFAGRDDLLSFEDLGCGAETGTQRGVHGSPVSGGISVLAGKVEGILDWHREIIRGAEGSCGRIAICAKTVRVGLPVVGVEACQQRGKIVTPIFNSLPFSYAQSLKRSRFEAVLPVSQEQVSIVSLSSSCSRMAMSRRCWTHVGSQIPQGLRAETPAGTTGSFDGTSHRHTVQDAATSCKCSELLKLLK